MSEFVVYAKMTREAINQSLVGDQTGIVIARFTDDDTNGLRIAREISTNFLDLYFPGSWEASDNYQYRIKGDPYGVAANITVFPERTVQS